MSDFKLSQRIESLRLIKQGIPQALGHCKSLSASIEQMQNGWVAYEASEPDIEARTATGLDFKSQAESIMPEAATHLADAMDGVADVLGVTRADVQAMISAVPPKSERLLPEPG